MAKSFLVSPGRAYLVIAEEGTKIVRTNGTLIDTVPEGANAVSITVDTHEIIVMDNAAKIQQLYNGNSGSSGIMTTAEGEDAGTWKIEIVSSLPEQGSAGVIYMLRTNRTGTDRYDDYIWIPEDNAYELLGRRPESTPVDLSNVAKTDVANIFTKSQQINGTLTATAIDVTRLSCDQRADIGTAAVNDLDYYTASGSSMTVSHVTILTSLHVAPQAAVTLPGVAWRTDTSGDYIEVTRKPIIDAVEIKDVAKVSNVLTLGTGSIILNGSYRTIGVTNGEDKVTIESSCVRVLSSDAELLLRGTSISMQTRTGNRTLFSFSRNTDGDFVLNADNDVILNGAISMPGTLTVNNLNVTGTVTGITTGGGTTPTVDFSNGVTIMQVLTADDIVADTVAASTLSAGSSLSIAAEPVIYRHTDGSTYIRGGVVNATRIETLTFFPKNIQGATFIGPLVMTKDNALRVWRSGSVSEISNGNITGFYYAQIDQCTITQSLTTDTGKARNVSITDTLVVKDLVVTGATTGIQVSGFVEGDLTVSGRVSSVSVLAGELQLNAEGGTPDVNNAQFSLQLSSTGTPIVKLQNTNASHQDQVQLEVPLMSAVGVLAEAIQVDQLTARIMSVSVVNELHTTLVEVLNEFDRTRIEPRQITLSNTSSRTLIVPGEMTISNYGDKPGITLSTHQYSSDVLGSVCDVLIRDEYKEGYESSPVIVLHVPSLHLGRITPSDRYPYIEDPATFMIALRSANSSSVCCLGSDESGELALRAYELSSGGDDWNAIKASFRVPTLYADSIEPAGDGGVISVMAELRVAGGLSVIATLVADEAFDVGDQLHVSAYGDARITSLSVIDTLRVGSVDVDTITVRNKITSSDLVFDGALSTLSEEVQTTPTGTADTLCRWAQIGSSHNMLSKGQLMYVDIPGPSVQKLPSGSVVSFVLSLWYQADSAGTDFRLIGSSTNAVKPVAGTTTSNRWNFNELEIKDEYLGRNLRLLMLTDYNIPSTWTAAVASSQTTTSYIQGRYSTVSSDNDCALSASDSGEIIHKAILTAKFACKKAIPGQLLTTEQKALLDWLAANKDALTNLISSASA